MVEKANYPVTLLCQVMEVSRSGFYGFMKRLQRPEDPQAQRLIVKVRAIHKANDEAYGSRRMSQALRIDGDDVGRYQAGTLMKKANVEVKQKKRFRATTDSKHNYPVAPNLLDRQFDIETPNTAWGGDITYLWTDEGWLYLAVIIDLFSRRVVGWSLSSRMKVDLVRDALLMAIWRRKPGRGLIHHSDRGSQYACHDYQDILQEHGMIPSMSRKGDCWDNAVIERFFRSLKSERTNHRRYQTRDAARQDVINYIEMFYNSRRLHSYLGYVSPAEYEKLAKVA
jgi:transposase InsO family protein